jgi:hypothetical protein
MNARLSWLNYENGFQSAVRYILKLSCFSVFSIFIRDKQQLKLSQANYPADISSFFTSKYVKKYRTFLEKIFYKATCFQISLHRSMDLPVSPFCLKIIL